MKIINQVLKNTFILELDRVFDNRGSFTKIINPVFYDQSSLNMTWVEDFYSTSSKDVLRGMHFQSPPFSNFKLVTCITGSILDVLIDLRSGSDYGRIFSIELSSSTPIAVLIPPGVAHGFVANSSLTTVSYKTSAAYEPTADSGILWNSFNFNWPIKNPVISSRDMNHIHFSKFETPF
jgi:dTDP-4-dehydrorhamnose 3,5-epimerase